MATLLRDTREYTDLDFSFARHPMSSNVSVKKKINAVKQSIMNLLQLREGDKPFHPEIKSPIYDYLFENATSVMKIVLESEILKYLSVYEPRVIINSIVISFSNNNQLNCEIYGEIINIQEPFTVSILVSRLR
jgi:phage baseplate assembly protein W